MRFEYDQIWLRIQAYQIDRPGVKWPFYSKLAKEQGWTAAFTARAIEEYKRFIYLCCISTNGASPSKVVDEVWHLHLTYTVDYWVDFCKGTLDKEIHHHPSKGGAEEDEKHNAWYAQTLELYEQTFGTKPPEDIWPPLPQVSDEAIAFAPKGSGIHLLLLLVPFLVIWYLYGQGNPFRISGKHFLVFYPALVACCFGAVVFRYVQLIGPLKRVLWDIDSPDVYELAYLTGGAKRTALMLITDLIDKEVLVHNPHGLYLIDHSKLSLIKHPFADELTRQEVVSFEYLQMIAERVAEHYTMKYSNVQAAFVKKEVFLPLIIMGMIGLMRVMQGLSNGRPVLFLGLMLVVSLIGFRAVVRGNAFHKACTWIFRYRAPAYIETTSGELTRLVLFSGFAMLGTMPAFAHLYSHFGTPVPGVGWSFGSGDGGGGSCGSSCGGGCGGGCGGRGGCGG